MTTKKALGRNIDGVETGVAAHFTSPRPLNSVTSAFSAAGKSGSAFGAILGAFDYTRAGIRAKGARNR